MGDPNSERSNLPGSSGAQLTPSQFEELQGVATPYFVERARVFGSPISGDLTAMWNWEQVSYKFLNVEGAEYPSARIPSKSGRAELYLGNKFGDLMPAGFQSRAVEQGDDGKKLVAIPFFYEGPHNNVLDLIPVPNSKQQESIHLSQFLYEHEYHDRRTSHFRARRKQLDALVKMGVIKPIDDTQLCERLVVLLKNEELIRSLAERFEGRVTSELKSLAFGGARYNALTDRAARILIEAGRKGGASVDPAAIEAETKLYQNRSNIYVQTLVEKGARKFFEWKALQPATSVRPVDYVERETARFVQELQAS